MKKGILRTAFPLTYEQRSQIRRRFEKIAGETVEWVERVEPGLIGGLQVEIDGVSYNASIKARLLSAAAELRNIEPIATGDDSSYDFNRLGESLKARLAAIPRETIIRASGEALRSGDGVAFVSGLSGCRVNEMIEFDTGGFGIAMNLDEHSVGVVLLGNNAEVAAGQRAWGTGQVLSVPVGDELIGRVVNPLGLPLDGGSPIHAQTMRPIESPAPSVLARKPVDRPLETGLVAIDAIVPIGRGQRELIIGDRQTGKTSVATDAILNQKDGGVKCFYVAIGQKASSVARIVETLRKEGAMSYTCVVCATASDSPTMQYIAPYCACAMAEYYMESGRDALIVYDDLSKHAVTYRTLSLLLRRPPGREAYPGDVFYLHARLLERAAQLSDANGGGSLTALPIIETQAGDISAYIPTNVISITDGQIFLDSELFREGQRPAINSGLSVSRVGGAAQTKAMRKAASQLRLDLAQYREMQVFSRFSSDMDSRTKDLLDYGERLNALMTQANNSPLDVAVQVCMLYTLTRALIPRDVTIDMINRWKKTYPEYLRSRYPALLEEIATTRDIGFATEDTLREALSQWRREATA